MQFDSEVSEEFAASIFRAGVRTVRKWLGYIERAPWIFRAVSFPLPFDLPVQLLVTSTVYPMILHNLKVNMEAAYSSVGA